MGFYAIAPLTLTATQALAQAAGALDVLDDEKPPLAALVRVLDRGHAPAKTEAARALYALAADSAEVRERLVFHHDAVAPLERLLDSQDATARVLAAAALRTLGAPPPPPSPPPADAPAPRRSRPTIVVAALLAALGLAWKGRRRRRRSPPKRAPAPSSPRAGRDDGLRAARARIQALTRERDAAQVAADDRDADLGDARTRIRELTAARDAGAAELAALKTARSTDAERFARERDAAAAARSADQTRFLVERDASAAASASAAARAADRQRHGLTLARERDAAVRQLALVRAELDAAKAAAKRGLFFSADDPVLPMSGARRFVVE